jgi:hypothetical protein
VREASGNCGGSFTALRIEDASNPERGDKVAVLGDAKAERGGVVRSPWVGSDVVRVAAE